MRRRGSSSVVVWGVRRLSTHTPAASILPVRPVALYDLGVVPYTQAWHWQTGYVARRLRELNAGGDVGAGAETLGDALMVLQHEPVFTLGRGSTTDNVLADLDSPPPGMPPVLRVERGGEVTYHGPGQLVLYPLLCLGNYKRDLRWYVQRMEDVVINALQHYGIEGHREEGAPGVWVGGTAKVAAIGMTAKRWHTMHGLSFNISVDLDPYRYIVPCGIQDKGVTSLEKLTGRPIDLDDAKSVLLDSFRTVFDVEYVDPAVTLDEAIAIEQ